MNTIEKRDYIHNHLGRLLDKDIDEMFEKVKLLIEENIILTEEQETELTNRIERHKNGTSKSYTWPNIKDEIHNRI
ncbi:hypothetical protein [Carboxylicivirga sp. N1Y90]|uniref:hypothetical protein n=1 Tax=Carboxylicivirga fragile TaxID=3417571 RepID=UPI003D33F959|nr:hypothetical protein [Marinilabiliaceae bacterium N1Y90]